MLPASFQGAPVVSLLAPLRGFPFWGQALEPLYKVIVQPAWARLGCDSAPSCSVSTCLPQHGLLAAQSCVSSRVSGLQDESLLLQLLLRLWELLATWARGSERMRYLKKTPRKALEWQARQPATPDLCRL